MGQNIVNIIKKGNFDGLLPYLKLCVIRDTEGSVDHDRKRKGGDKHGTFVAKKKFRKGTGRYNLHREARQTLGVGDYELAIAVPQGITPFEWHAVNTVVFFNQINLLYGIAANYCSEVLVIKLR